MFGRNWEKAEATIVSKHVLNRSTNDVAAHEYVVDIMPADGVMFRAKVDEPMIATDFWAPNIRDVVTVEINDKHDKVRFDKDDPRLSYKAYKAATREQFEAASQAAPGAAAPALGFGRQITGLGATRAFPDGVAEMLAERLAQFGGQGGSPIVISGGAGGEPLKEAIRAAQAGHAAAGEPDAASRLAKLEALRQRGLVSDEEYHAARARIIEAI